MNSKDRVSAIIQGKPVDRIPIYAWLRSNLEEPLTQTFGSVEAFEDTYEFDLAHLFGGPDPHPWDEIKKMESLGDPITPEKIMDIPLQDPNEQEKYKSLIQEIDFYKHQRQRFVYMQTPGLFECLNAVFGIENHLLYMAMYPDLLKQVYDRQAHWNKQFALNCIDLGVDMVHISDDWGAQTNTLFSPTTWWELIYPYQKITVDASKKAGALVSIHSDGNIMSVLDGVVELGFNVVHPFQESAGMDYQTYISTYQDRFAIMGGLDIQTTLGFNKYDFLQKEIDRILELFKKRGIILCTTHYVQKHCSMDELSFAFDYIYKKIRE